jgi:hypothetical protein
VLAAAWHADLVRAMGICAAVLLGGWGLWALRAARLADGGPVALAPLGRVSGPTCLTIALAALGAAYHLLAYSVARWITLLAVPIDRWWVVAVVVGAAATGALMLDRLEPRRGEDEGGGPA